MKLLIDFPPPMRLRRRSPKLSSSNCVEMDTIQSGSVRLVTQPMDIFTLTKEKKVTDASCQIPGMRCFLILESGGRAGMHFLLMPTAKADKQKTGKCVPMKKVLSMI